MSVVADTPWRLRRASHHSSSRDSASNCSRSAFARIAGKIHSDIERGFIRAETIAYADLLELGNEKNARDAGKMRAEGKEYIVRDGDIINFRFNV